jgi:hypothetical protein
MNTLKEPKKQNRKCLNKKRSKRLKPFKESTFDNSKPAFNKRKADKYFDRLNKEIVYLPDEISKTCKEYKTPSQFVAYGDFGVRYHVANTPVLVKPWTPVLLELRNFVCDEKDYKYNFVLVQNYCDGSDGTKYQRDKEILSDGRPTSVILSFGQERHLFLIHANFKKSKNFDEENKILLKHGALLKLHHSINKNMYQSIPKQVSARGQTIILTFKYLNNLYKPKIKVEKTIPVSSDCNLQQEEIEKPVLKEICKPTNSSKNINDSCSSPELSEIVIVK